MREKKHCPLLDRLAGAAHLLDREGLTASAEGQRYDNHTVADLLEALEACANAMHADNPADGWKEILDDARAALAKAYGEGE